MYWKLGRFYETAGHSLRTLDPKDTPAPVKGENRDQRKERKRKERAELQAYKIEQGIALWNPADNGKATTDPYKTLFVGRIDFDTSESKLRREFETYGNIKRVIVARDQEEKFRGYAFIEYEHERDMHAAYKSADGRKINGKRVLVDVERGRTVKGWLPRRLGGGLGNTRRPKGPGGVALDEGEGGPSREESQTRRRGASRERERGGSRGGGSGARRSRSPRERKERRRSRSRSKERPERTERRRDRGDKEPRRDRDAERPERRRSKERTEKDRGERRRSRDRDSRRDRDKDRDRRDRGEPDAKREVKTEPDQNGNGEGPPGGFEM